VLVPILDPLTGDRVIGVVLMRIDPAKFFYPFILHWPTPSETAEILLVRREGDDVLFLSDHKDVKNAALNLRIPLSRTDAPTVMAVLGHVGIVAGHDAHGKLSLLADIRSVPDSP
jgi:hypothetical protein